MLTWPGDGSHRTHLRSSRLSPKEEQELELDNLDLGFLGECPSTHPPWEDALVSRIRDLLLKEQSLALDTIYHCLEKHNQLWEMQKVSDTDDIQDLMELLSLDPQRATEKAFLFYLYGLILRECHCMEQVKCHLANLLELSHQNASQREGMAIAVGLASTKHMEEVWALLENLGRTKFLRAVLGSNNQLADSHWKWISSTYLLCYGQMASQAKEQVLPWVDNIASRMAYYFSSSRCDDVLKSSFLSAVVLLTRALRQKYSAQNYKFTQTPELIQCLLGILQKEPNFLDTLFRQKVILVIVSLSNLRPSLKPLFKSQVLKVCLRSMYTLSPIGTLKDDDLPLSESALHIKVLYRKTFHALDLLLQNFILENPSMDELCFLLQHTEYWLKSDKSRERKRAVRSIFLLLHFVVDYLTLPEESVPSILGHQVGLLTLLWKDKDKDTCRLSYHCVLLLLRLLVQQKGKVLEPMFWTKMRSLESRRPSERERKFTYIVKAFHDNLTVAQHTQLVLTLLCALGSRNHFRCYMAAKLVQMICEALSVRKEQVAEILQGFFKGLPQIHFQNVQETIQKAIVALGTQHSQEVVEVTLLCPASERRVLLLWKMLGTTTQLAREVMILLYMKLKLRPRQDFIRPSYEAQLVSLMALDTIYELLYTPEYKSAVSWAFAGLLLGLLTQLHYLFELGLVEGVSDYQEDILDSKPLGPGRTCLEALKGLFWTNHYWEVFAYVKLLQGWNLLENLETYPKGVALLARAMAHYNCEVKAVLGQAIISLKSTEDRENIVAIFIITEFLNSPGISKYVSLKAIEHSLSLGLRSSNQLVRAMSLKGLGCTLMHPKKVGLLQNQMLELLNSLLKAESQELVGLMELMGDLLHSLGVQNFGPISIKIAQHLLSLFKDERAEVREGAIFLFGDVIHCGGAKVRQAHKALASKAVVPLFFHMADPCPEVAMKAKFTFLRCAILLKWEFRKDLFGKLAWGQGLGAENDIFIYTVESNFGNYQQFFREAMTYLDSPHKTLKLAAMKFIGGMLQDYFSDLCLYLKKGDVISLKNRHLVGHRISAIDLETLSQDSDSMSRKFYLNYWEDITELYNYMN